jgi:hypothetical protein
MFNNKAGTDMMKQMHDAIKKVVVDATGKEKPGEQDRRDETEKTDESGEAWHEKLANGFGWGGSQDEDDIRSRATYDTWDEENSVLRRLGSWGTVNSQFTAGTAGTSTTLHTMATNDTDGPSVVGPVSKAVAAAAAAKEAAQDGNQLAVPGSHLVGGAAGQKPEYLDDDGKLIDPALVEAAMRKQEAKKKKKRKPKKKTVVKFDYPPVKSLKQYSRPDPEDLPNLFFTEHELDQIEDDRYSTMSTDDIEIVAVESKEAKSPTSNDEDDAFDARVAKKSQDQQPQQDKSVKGRSGTPIRRRSRGGGEASDSKKSPAEPDNPNEKTPPRRLVKGVQIYLRERSTGT